MLEVFEAREERLTGRSGVIRSRRGVLCEGNQMDGVQGVS